jgi:hypothetical protein
MKSEIFISFAAGLVTGAAVAYLLITERLQQKMDQELAEQEKEYRDNIDYITELHKKEELRGRDERPEEYVPKTGFSDIEILDPQTFQEGMLGYEFFEVDCYVNDNVVADDTGNRMKESAEELIGSEAMKSGGAYGADPHDVFVRNHKLRMDLHVHLLDSDWVEDVDWPGYYYTGDDDSE